MKITSIFCDICKRNFSYPEALQAHRHLDLEIGGVPINFWTPVYHLPKQNNLVTDKDQKGVLKYRDYLPVDNLTAYSKNEGGTPLRQLDNLSKKHKIKLYLKDESANPTGSFKDRGMPLLLASAKTANKKRVAIPSTGNAAVSLAFYARAFGLEAIVFIPETTAYFKKKAIIDAKATIVKDKNLIESYEHFFSFCRKNSDVYNGFPANNIPYLQGLKTMAYEIFLQLGNKVPDWLIVPCGSGGNLVGQYQGFRDLIKMGLADKIPHLVSVQIKGADPITVGFQKKQIDKIEILKSPCDSKAEAIASDTCFNYFKIIKTLMETGGRAISVKDEDIDHVTDFGWLEYSSLSIFPALEKLSKEIKKESIVVIIGTALKRKN